MYELELESAVSEIHQACENRSGSRSPFFFIVGAGISAPTIPIASEIESECKAIAINQKRTNEPKSKTPLDSYSHWFEAAWPNAEQRQQYLRKKIERRLISPAALRLAHLLLNGAAGNLVITPNFDDFLSKALTLFGQPHIICDHPNTISRVSIESDDLKIVHVHGTFWFYDCVNLKAEIAERADSNPKAGTVTIPSFLELLLWNRSPIVMGYSGWEGDAIMTALQKRLKRAMGFNIYWFCYKRSDLDCLPLWLKEHPGVRFIAPKVETTSALTEGAETTETGVAASQVLKSGVGAIETLPAVRVLDLLNRSFKLDPPPLTEKPLEFFADQITRSVFPDEAGQPESDFYDFKSVIAKVQTAAELLKRQDVYRSEIDLALEGLRNAVRRSDYREAIKIAREVPRIGASSEQLEEVMSAASAAAENLFDNSPEELEGYDVVCEIGAILDDKKKLTSAAAHRWASALFNKGVTLIRLNRSEEAIAAYDEVVRRFGDSGEPALREQVARAMFNKGPRLGRLNRSEEAIATYDEVVRRFGDATESTLRQQVVMALRMKGITLGQLNRSEEEILVYEELARRFGDATEPAVRDQVAMALRNKGITLGQLNRSEEEIAAYDGVVRRFGNATEPVLREQVGIALRNKGITLGRLNRSGEAIAAYEEVVRRFGDATEPALLKQVAKALFNKGLRLGQSGGSEEAITTYEEVVRRFGDAAEPALREQVGIALRNKGFILDQLNRSEEAIAIYEEVVRRFGDDTEPALRKQVAKALFSKGLRLGQLGRSEEAIAAYEEVVRRFGDASEPSLREQVAKTLFNKGISLGQLGRREDEIAVYEEVVRRFGDASESALSEQVAKALRNKGVSLGQLGRREEETAVYEEVIRRFGGSAKPRLQRLVVEALLSQAEILKEASQPAMVAAKVTEIVARYSRNTDPVIQDFVSKAKKLITENDKSQGASV